MKSNAETEQNSTAGDPYALEALWAAEDERSLSGHEPIEQTGGPTDGDGHPTVLPPPPPPGEG